MDILFSFLLFTVTAFFWGMSFFHWIMLAFAIVVGVILAVYHIQCHLVSQR